MFRILEHQMARLGERSRAGFVTRMADYLASAYAADVAGMTRPELEAWVDSAVAKAEHYGVTMEPEVAQLLLLLLLLGADADTDKGRPWVHEALADRDLAGRGKVRKLIHLARAHRVDGVERVAIVREVSQP